MEFNQILELINTISDSKVTSFTLEKGNQKITIKSGDKAPQIVQMPAIQPQTVAMAPMTMQPMTAPQTVLTQTEGSNTDSSKEEPVSYANLKLVKSPLVGTFYCAPSPDDEPYVKPGDTVKKGQIIGIIEAMKLMNEIECEHDGVVQEIMVNNGDMVEYGQTLIKIK